MSKVYFEATLSSLKRSCWRLHAAHRKLHKTESSPAEPWAAAKSLKSWIFAVCRRLCLRHCKLHRVICLKKKWRNEKWETLQCLLLWSPVIRVRRMLFLINDYCLLISRILYPYIFARARPLASLFASFSFCSGLCLGIWKSFRDFVRFGKQLRNWLFPSEVLCFSIQVFARIDSPVHLLHFYYEFVLYSFHEAYEYTNIGSLSRESSSTLGLSLLRICFALWTTKRRWHRLLWICGCLDVWACSSARWRNGEWVSLNYGMQVGWNVV